MQSPISYYPSWSEQEATETFRLPADRDLRKARTVCLRPECDPNDRDALAAECAAKKEQIRQYMHATFEIYEKVYAPLNSDEAYTIPPVHRLRHPLIFYLGHTATFYMNKLTLAGLTTRINAKYEETFAIGVDEMSWDDLNEAHYDWPAVKDVWGYRRLVRARIDSLFNDHTLPLPLTMENSNQDADHLFFWAIMMAIEHERIHLETASVHVRELPMRFVTHYKYWDPCTEDVVPPTNELVAFAGGSVAVGRRPTDDMYGWDSDYATDLRIDVAPFETSKYLVSNKEFFEFVQDGGYAERKWWDEEGWNWVSWKKPQHPWFWVKAADGSFLLRTQCTEIPLPWSWPCEVNHLEAHAFCNWKTAKTGVSLRLPTEAEWLHLWDRCVAVDQHRWGDKAPGNINMEAYTSSCPVNKFAQGPLYDVVGNAWQHCETPVYPYSGYKVHPLYDDFSMPTFDGRHRCMKGGAWVSTGNEATRDARFAFRRHFFQYIGIRYIKGEPVDEMAHTKDVLGLDPEVDLVAHKSFTPLPDSVPVSPRQPYGKTLAELSAAAFKAHSKVDAPRRALDLLCGAGRASYELSLLFKEVVGVDFSARMLQPAYSMKERGAVSYCVTDAVTGGKKSVVVTAEGEAWADRRNDVVFYQSDPANLHAHLRDFDMILAFNIQDQNTSYNPRLVPEHLISRLNSGGILFVAEPKTKMHEAALSAADYIAAIGDGAEVVVAPTLTQLYLPQSSTTGSIVDFECFAVRKN